MSIIHADIRDMPDPMWFAAYRGTPPWEIGRAQPAFVELAEAGLVVGSVIDMGCGTGDNVLEMAERGHEAYGIDIVPMAIDQARAKAKLRGMEQDVTFLVGDALEAEHLGRTFDTILDCGLFHSLSDPERAVYESQLAAISHEGTVLHLMAMSDWEDAAWGGPRRVSQAEIMDCFREGWRVDDIQEARFTTRFEKLRAHAWLSTIVREAAPTKARKRRAAPNKPKALPAPAPVKVDVGKGTKSLPVMR